MIVDASVAVKWFYEEEGSETARRLAATDLIAPDLIYPEVGNALWKKQKRGELANTSDAATRLADILFSVVPSLTLATRAFDLARTLDHPIYDCFYLALALASDRLLVTSDERFFERCAGTVYAKQLLDLARWDAR